MAEPVRFTAVVSPKAGGGHAPDRLAAVVAILLERSLATGRQLEITEKTSRSLAHASELAAAAGAAGDTVIAVGGDGMTAAVAAGAVESGARLGFVPCGRGNDFARVLGYPLAADASGVADILLGDHERTVDVLTSGGQVVLSSVYAGFDSESNEIANRSRFVPAAAVYPVAAVRALAGFSPKRFRLELDGVPMEAEGALVVVANSPCYGGGMRVAPEADLADGLADVVIVKITSKRHFPAVIRAMYAGTHVDRADVEVVRARRVVLDAGADVPIYADGELLARGKVEARIQAAALRVLVPVLADKGDPNS